jgi:outer membrane protein OmpA-like peptidoglycan-associated protein
MKKARLALLRSAAFLVASSLGAAVGAQGAGTNENSARFAEAGAPFRLVERSDYSRYLNGKYMGHAYREARGSLAPAGDGYAGEFFVLEETLRDMRNAARRVDRTVPVRLTTRGGSSFDVREDSGYPSLRGVPSFPTGAGAPKPEDLAPGSMWTAEGSRAFDFDDSGAFVLMPFLAQYRYVGIVDYRGKKVRSLSAKFAVRWKAGTASASDFISSANGTHELDILVDAETWAALFIRDRFDDSFALSAGGSERRSGFSLFFFEGSAAGDRGATGAAIAAAIDGGGRSSSASAAVPETPLPGAGPGPLLAGEGPGIDETMDPGAGVADAPMRAAGLELDTSPEGLVLRVKDLRFVADSDEILASEKGRLDLIASALKALPGKSFLIAGHSAAVGKAAGELELSILRAKRVTAELAARGIEASRLLYRGFGSGRPLAPNDTEEGRAKNRRVEITILD